MQFPQIEPESPEMILQTWVLGPEKFEMYPHKGGKSLASRVTNN